MLRNMGFHTRRSYKSTRNVGKLLTEAAKANATYAVILGEELADNNLVIKNLKTGEQESIPRGNLLSHIS